MAFSSQNYRRFCLQYFDIRQQLWNLGILEDYHKLLLDSNGRLDNKPASEFALSAFNQLTGCNGYRLPPSRFNSLLKEVFRLDGPWLNFEEVIQRLIRLSHSQCHPY